jgi:hypothetical protein
MTYKMVEKTDNPKGKEKKSLGGFTRINALFLMGLSDLIILVVNACSGSAAILLMLLAGMPLLLAIYLKYSAGLDTMQTFKSLFVFQLVLLPAIFWFTLNLLMFDCPSSTDPVVKEWSKLQPLTPSIEYYGTQWGNDSGRFIIQINAVGTTINVTGAEIKEGLTGAICETSINGRPVASLAGSGETVHAGEYFKLDAFCMPAGKEGDPYRMVIKVNFSRTQGGVIILYNHTGIVEGKIS